ncbi:hypothetical protein ACFYXF_24470 [Streptomyces sp. NPDC002680]|uniref:hypothetical protein n=1 Tax=Streptomyces sp. NPDC002680 TaxID=3364659 RepID=UPI00367DCA02
MSDQTADISPIKESARSLSKIHREFSRNANPADGLGRDFRRTAESIKKQADEIKALSSVEAWKGGP